MPGAGRAPMSARVVVMAALVALLVLLLRATGGEGLASAAPPPPWLGLVANNESPFDSVRLFDPVALQATANVGVGGDNVWVGVAPDGSAAYAQVVYPSARFER